MNLSSIFIKKSKADTRYFIIDSGKNYDDVDFEKYVWQPARNNKIRNDDLFIYRKSNNVSALGRFYLYGAGRFKNIRDISESYPGHVEANLTDSYSFDAIMQDRLENFNWTWKKKGKNWANFFNQYGINNIPREDFFNLLELVDGDYDETEDESRAYQEMHDKDYFVPDAEAMTKTRPWQNAWSQQVKKNYGYKCAVCELADPNLLIGSHIIPVAVKNHRDKRKDPSNGICLCVIHDKLFDKGYFTFADDYEVRISLSVVDNTVQRYLDAIQGSRLRLPIINKPKTVYLNYHLENVFIK